MNSKWLFLGIAALGGVILLSTKKAKAKPTPSIYYGVYTGSNSSGIPSPAVELDQFEYDSDKKVSIVGMVTWWYDTFEWGDFNTLLNEWSNNIRNHGSIPLILWQPFNPLRSDGTAILITDSDYSTQIKKYSLKRIAAGYLDDYIRTWARQIKAWRHPVMMRPMHELNCSTTIASLTYAQAWCADLRDIDGSVINEPTDAITAWKRIVDIFRAENTNNVTWVWSVLSWPSPLYGGNNNISLNSIYPGDDYVDWIGIECYNRDFLPLAEACNDYNIQGIYQEVVALSPTKYMLMAEMGAKEDIYNPDAKPEWIKNALSVERTQSIIFKYPRIKAIFWWNDGRNNMWIESSNKTMNAFREVIANYYYGTNDYFDLNTSPISLP